MQHEQNKTKVNRINVYLNSQDRKVLNEIKDKYHISYSTIANIIITTYINNYADIVKKIKKNYLYEEDNSSKTSIKPRISKYWGKDESLPITKVFTNGIKIFTRNGFKEVLKIEDKEISKIKSKIYNEFQNTYDPNWDGNSFTRRAIKVFKNNKDYIKRISGQEDM